MNEWNWYDEMVAVALCFSALLGAAITLFN